MQAGAEKRATPTSDQVTVARSTDAAVPGIVVTIQPGKEDYPGIRIPPDGGSWDLAAYGHVEARVVNTGDKPLFLSLRVDNAGNWQDNPWNTESITLAPGASGTISTIFGYAYGKKPGFALNPAAVVNVLLFAGKSDSVQSFRLESLQAAGPAGEKPPVAPEDVRTKPVSDTLFGPGAPAGTVAASAVAGAQVSVVPGLGPRPALRTVIPATSDAVLTLKPVIGRWDLRDYLEVRVAVRNGGTKPETPRVRLETNGGTGDWITAPAPLAPGAAGTIVIPFLSAGPIDLSKPETNSRLTSDAVSAVTIGVLPADNEQAIIVDSVRAGRPAASLPGWLGKRPPVEGEWVKTLDEEFKDKTLDTSIWSIYGENYWDKQSHWSKDDILLGDGVVKLRYEKKTGFNNDDPKAKSSNYAAGYLHTYDKWSQRYGYFEARMKLPTAPGLWPAFWMMPDRRDRSKSQGERQDTGNGGMEFDIMEHLTRWGPTRYNIAMHYDGYGSDHKSLGSDRIYIQPDKDGYITCGLLWTPGLAVYYGNGREVLRWENPRISNVPEILMFTLPMGGWDNSPLEDAKLPDDFIIDYVRVWQRKDLSSPTDGKLPSAPPDATAAKP